MSYVSRQHSLGAIGRGCVIAAVCSVSKGVAVLLDAVRDTL